MTDSLDRRFAQYDAVLLQKGIPSKYHSYYRMWLRSFQSYCRTQGVPELHAESLDRFMLAMAEQGKAAFQQKQATHAVSLYRDSVGDTAAKGTDSSGAGGNHASQGELNGDQGKQTRTFGEHPIVP